MFFVNRRNSSDYIPATNANGTTNFSTNAIRLDLLTATNIIDSDILDVRRQIQIPSVSELLDTSFEQLMDGRLKTRMVLDTAGGDKFGTEIFQLDLVGTGPAGTLLNASLTDAVEGNISSQATLTPVQYSVNASSSVPTPQTFTNVSGIFHPNTLYQSAVYGPNSGIYTGQTVPGYFTGYGTNQLTFTFNSSAAISPPVSTYLINATQINTSSATLSQIPSTPELVKNISGTSGNPDFYYQGVFSDSTGTLIEQWPSDNAPGYYSYAIVYPGSDTATSRTETMASTVEVHYLVMADSTNFSTTNATNDTLTIPSYIAPADAPSQYNIMSVSKIINVTAGFSYKVKNIIVNSSTLNIQTVPGFPFIQGTVFEVIGQTLSSTALANTRNGASVNFTSSEIGTFCYSVLANSSGGYQTNPITVPLPNNSKDSIIGICSTDTTGAIASLVPFCWVGSGDVHSIKNINGFDSSVITFDIADVNSVTQTVYVQVLTKQNTLTYSTTGGTNPDGLMIGYDYVPYQAVSELPLTLSAQVALKPTVINVSNLGTGGSAFAREPYEQPLVNIPVNNPLLLNDDSFYNIEPLRFANFSIDGGFAQLPAYVPGNLGGIFNLSVPMKDNLSRYFYSANSQEFNFRTEGLLTPVSRKVFAGILGRVLSASDSRLLRGEYVLMIISQDAFLNMNNSVGFNANSNSVIAIYRLPNRPMVRI